MPRFVIALLLSLTLIASAAESQNYRIVKSARLFAIGGIRHEGAITAEETAFNALCKELDAAQHFRRLLSEASIEGPDVCVAWVTTTSRARLQGAGRPLP